MPIWLAGLVASEVPLALAGTQLALGVRAARRSRGLQRLITVSLAAGSAAASVQMYRRASGAQGVLHDAIEKALGVADDATVGQRARPGSTGSLLALRARYTTEVTRGLAYGDVNKFNSLDVWRRPDLPHDGAAPVLVQLHGGAWTSGDNRSQALPLLAEMAEQGWVCVVPRYRLSPTATFPDHIVDVMRAIAWTKQHVAEFGGDPAFVALTGGSAGAHLSSLAALAHDHIGFKPGFENVDTSVQAVVPLYGAYDWTDRDHTGNPNTQRFLERLVIKRSVTEAAELFDQGSPRSWVRPDAPPFFVIHGRNDALLPVEQARAFVADLRATSGSPVAYAELPDAQHAWDYARTRRNRASVAAISEFLHRVHATRHNPALDKELHT